MCLRLRRSSTKNLHIVVSHQFNIVSIIAIQVWHKACYVSLKKNFLVVNETFFSQRDLSDPMSLFKSYGSTQHLLNILEFVS